MLSLVQFSIPSGLVAVDGLAICGKRVVDGSFGVNGLELTAMVSWIISALRPSWPVTVTILPERFSLDS